METILIAGGTGLVGKQLAQFWKAAGHEVRLLSRGTSDPLVGKYQWNPLEQTLDEQSLEGVTVLVNLTGAGIGDKRWSKKRKQELYDSRVGTTRCLWKFAQSCDTLKHYISASGAVCYGFEDDQKTYKETDPFGSDLLSDLTKEWEAAADLFATKCLVTKVRISIVLSADGGALPTIAKPIRMGFGSFLGSGKQAMPWIHISDLVSIFDWVLTQKLEGVYHANAGNTDNASLTRAIAKTLHKSLWMPNAPSWVIRLLFGEMAVMVLKGLKTDNKKLLATGFVMEHLDLEETINEVYRKK